MEYRGGRRPNYSEEAIRAVVDACNIDVVSETGTHFLCYCIFHENTGSPSFVVQKNEQGLFYCFNPSCEESGNLIKLVKKVKECSDLEAARLVVKFSRENARPISDIINKKLQSPPSFVEFGVDFSTLHDLMWSSPAYDYMVGRGFEDRTLKEFMVGYSQNQNMVIVPMYSPAGLPIGLIGRSIQEKRFKNSTGLPKKETLWNFNNAKKVDQVIIVESSFDAMRIHQAGYPGVVATLGPISPRHIEQISKTFTSVVIMTDNDPKRYETGCARCRKNGSYMCLGHSAGLELGKKISESVKGKKVFWANWGETRFPPSCKDASDCSDDQIRQMINGKSTLFELKMKYNFDLT